MLDYGCGSCILGLMALQYGAKSATGVDIDRDSLLSACRNCQSNKKEMDLYQAYDGDHVQSSEELSISSNVLKGIGNNSLRSEDTEGIDEQIKSFPDVSMISGTKYDIVVANILAPILISLAPVLASFTAKGGRIGLSGVFSSQAKAVIDRFVEFYDDVCVANEEDNWVLITGVRK